jgi:hypothetical protein
MWQTAPPGPLARSPAQASQDMLGFSRADREEVKLESRRVFCQRCFFVPGRLFREAPTGGRPSLTRL